MCVLVADKLDQAGLDNLQRLGCDVHFHPDATADQLPDLIREHDPDCIIVRSTKVTAESIQAGRRLSLIVRAGAGYNTIDIMAASSRGIFVANCPGKNSLAVAELAWGLILSCDRRIPQQTEQLKAGKWNKKEFSAARGLSGRTLGVIGLGRIGLAIAQRGRAFGMNVAAWSRSLTHETAEINGVDLCENPVNLARISDVISISVAANDDTENMIDEKFLAAMKPGAILVNTSRGSVIDQAALAETIRQKNLRVGLDVFANEPGSGTGEFTDQIVSLENVIGTHHIGASTEQAQEAIATEAVNIVRTYATTGDVRNCVNRADKTAATCQMIIRHLNKPGVLAHVFDTLSQSGINVDEMENLIYTGEEAACARIRLSSSPSTEDLESIKSNSNIMSITLTNIA
ncbi:MAG: hydroxyacid dehydrogenase [Phycisphaerae bacterium]|nr:hydroxyacid dehydrogenase [Phycisphaerae bacterium]